MLSDFKVIPDVQIHFLQWTIGQLYNCLTLILHQSRSWWTAQLHKQGGHVFLEPAAEMLHILSLPNVSCSMPFIAKNFREVQFPVKSIFPGYQISRDVNPVQSNFLGRKLYMEANFPGKSTFPVSQLSPEVNFSRQSMFPGIQLSQKVIFPGKSTFRGS